MYKFDETKGVFIPPEIDTWYQLKFDSDTGYLVIIHHKRNEPLVKDGTENYHEMRRVVFRATKISDKRNGPSTAYKVLNKKLNNKKDLRGNKRLKDYLYARKYDHAKNSGDDLTDIADNLLKTGMPKDFIAYFFHVKNGDLIIRTIVTQADITNHKLDIDTMEKYVWSRKQLDEMPNFTSKKSSGWYPNGKPPIFKRYNKRQK